MKRSPLAAAAAALAATLAAAAPDRAEAYSALYVFGDSLSDRGNLLALSGGLAPVAPTYTAGQFSNGPTWAQGLSQGLGLGNATASNLGGTVYAYGLARSDNAAPPLGLPALINLPGQVSAYIAGPNAPAGALFAVWAGANNLLQALAVAAAIPDPVAAATFLSAQTSGAVTGTLTEIGRLVGDGARDILVLNMPDLGLVPRFAAAGPAGVAAARAVSQGYNAGLAAGLAALDAIPGVRILTLDVYGVFTKLVANPAGFGFSNVTAPCVTGPIPALYTTPAAATVACTPAQAAVSLFWDPIHPTAAAHALIAQAALQAVPAPAAAGLLGIGLLGLVALRRRGASVS
jgi:phospholipase/lecithinase/hemolysin